MYVCVCTFCVPGSCREERADSLKLELWIAVSHHVLWVLETKHGSSAQAKYSFLLSHLSSPIYITF